MRPAALDGAQARSIHGLLQTQVGRRPNAAAIMAHGRPPLTYAQLWNHVQEVVRALNERGVGRNDRVALVLPNGPEMAVAFVAVAAGATNAPLNPAYSAGEFDFYLEDLNARALIVLSRSDSPAVAVARTRGIPIIELSPVREAPAGIFTLMGGSGSAAAHPGWAGPEDLALVLHTSGTTARPKVVPLTQGNICASAFNVKRSTQLSEQDRCLNVMPLFHVYGVTVTLATLAAGGSVVCSPGFDAARFFEWMEEFCPTWYGAVPTMHQALLAHAASSSSMISRSALRFISSSASPLPEGVRTELERLLRAPVREAYGMTEACLISSNPLPPGVRKPGSVGMAAGPEIAIMDEQGHRLPRGATGEIAIRGPSVVHRYENNPAANQSAFINGWFRTGDQGYLDEDGYLFLTGRIKELINRGGEKISPREIDERLMEHPAVMQAAAFGAPHPTLGETVAAVVVLREGAAGTAPEIRRFAAARLAPFKIPDPLLIVDQLPVGPTGKLQRIGLAEKLGLTARGPAEPLRKEAVPPPHTPLEEKLLEIWREVLDPQSMSVHDSFFRLGGDSLTATQVISRIRTVFQVELPIRALFDAPTVAELADWLALRTSDPQPGL
jgi:acyl-CoA synthetase (AMP-forming)/AMP-acid ligase II/acyl carrier protein